MDSRQSQQHPFSRNTTSQYGRNPFPAASNQPPYPASSHQPNNATPYSEHQRRPSDPPYATYTQRQYSGDGPQLTVGTHSRHQSSSSVGHSTPATRGMLPPSSPQQRDTQHTYGPPSRAPTVSVGPPSSFTSGRELPALPTGRPASNAGGSMSIHSILGGSSAAAREQASSHYASTVTTAGPQGTLFSGATHASPRMASAADYAPFRRPLTPEPQRSYEPRDHRANSAGSPPGAGQYTPDARRYGTPQSYGQRTIPPEERREPVRVPNPNVVLPPRPSSQPGSYNPPPRPSESRAPMQNDGVFGRREPVRAESLNREPPYQRSEYEERQAPGYAYAERARQEREREREAMLQREREHRERAEHSNSLQQEFAHQLSQRNAQAYSRAPEREVPSWMNRAYEPPRPAYEPIPEQAPHQREPLPGHDYSRATAPPYSGHPAYSSSEPRYQPPSQAASSAPQNSTIPASQYDAQIHERQRLAQQQEQQRQAMYTQSQNLPYQPQESPTRRPLEDAQQIQQQGQRNFLGVQEINRKGRASPLPQAVQGAQGQIGGPGGEPGIKSEFGRMFSGIGSGVGAMGVSSPVTAGPQSLPGSAQLRRDDVDGIHGQESPIENGGYKLARSPSRGGRRRKLREEDSRDRDDDSSTGRRTPSGSARGKRAKIHHHHHHNHHHHHHHRAEPLENTSPVSQSSLTPFKNIKGTTIPSPPDAKAAPALHHHHIPRHHHHQVTPAKPAAPQNVIVPVPKVTIRSRAVLDAVAHLPRSHLGHAYYQPRLKPTGINLNAPRTKLGFASTPEPLPRFEGCENCTFTIKVPRIHLSSISREEITYRRALWGTDVYTDDSDIIAACIHQGWFRGEWSEDVDVSLLGLELDDSSPDSHQDFLSDPPHRGPMPVPEDRDLHITVLILPQLEKYASTTRFGIRSREWGEARDGYQGTHDGLSFMVMNIKWVDGVDGAAGRSGGERKKMVVRDLVEAEREDEEWAGLFNQHKRGNINSVPAKESFERGSTGPVTLYGMKDIATKSWWKKPEKGVANSQEGKQVNLLSSENDIERVTETMIENANVGAERPLVDENKAATRPEEAVEDITVVQ